MKKFAALILAGLGLLNSCRKVDPIIADPLELTITTLSEDFICQPVTISDNTIGIVNKKNTTSLCNYDTNGHKIWQYVIDSLAVGSIGIPNVQHLDLKKDPQNNLLVTLIHVDPLIKYGIKMVKFDSNGQYLCQTSDSIHQRDTIIMGTDTIPTSGLGRFTKIGSVCLSGGNYAFVSSLAVKSIDSTFIQMSIYNGSGVFVTDNYFKIPRVRSFISTYTTSANILILVGTFSLAEPFIIANDMSGNIIFDKSLGTTLILNDAYFCQETSNGYYIISISYTNSTNNLRGRIYNLSPTGQEIVLNDTDFDPNWIMLSMREISDGYLFCGFDTDVNLIKGVDWRTTFDTDTHRALILKTGFGLTEAWHKIIEANKNSAGAVSTGQGPISFFGGKYESSGKKIMLVKLTNDGEIF